MFRAFAALACLAACTPSPRAIVIGRIVIDAPRSFDDKHASRDALRQAIVQRLDEDRSVKWKADAKNATHILQVLLSDTVPGRDNVANRIVEVRLRPVATATEFTASQRAPETGDPAATGLAGFDAAWADLRKLRQLEVAKDEALLAALESPDPRLREFAMGRVAERRLRSAVDPLCKRLVEEPEVSLLLKSIGALVSIGDERAVEPLIELSHQKDPGFVLQIVFAVGAIGGRTAEAYLVTMAGGHQSEDVRRGAQDALTELERRASHAKR